MTITSIGRTRGLGDPPDGRQISIPQWVTGRGDIHGAATRFHQPRSLRTGLPIKEGDLWTKQASRAWNLQFHEVLLTLDFKRTHSDAGVYHRQDHGGIIIIILYVDDITILSDSIKCVTQIKSTLSSCYKMTDLGEIGSYLGVRIKHNRSIRQLEIDQSHYTLEIINRFGLSDANPAHTPLPSGAEVHLTKYNGEATPTEIKLYQQIIGSLLYVQISTRPDISFAVSHLAQYASNPSQQHTRLAKYVLTYLKGTSNLKLQYDGARGQGLHGYSNSSYGDDLDDQHSTAGYVFLLADAAISWCLCKQQTAAQSCYDTAGSSSLTRVWRRLCDPRDDTKSYGLSVSYSFGVRSVQQHKVTPRMLNDSL